MKVINNRLQYLLNAYLSNSIKMEEERELASLILEEKSKQELEHYILHVWNSTHGEYDIDNEKAKKIISTILQHSKKEESAKIISMKKRKFSFVRLATASVFLLLIAGGYFIFSKYFFQSTPTETKPVAIVAPDKARATITLSDGSVVYLDDMQTNQAYLQEGINIIKENESDITYQPKEIDKSVAMHYNTLYNPKGSKVVNLTLSDGTKVWLNSETTLRYPIAFVGDKRQVEIVGEAFFDVATVKNKRGEKIPFTVSFVNKAVVEVLGTEFNVNAYADEPTLKTTLVRGSVKVSTAAATNLINPGEQALVNDNGNISIDKSVDITKIISWKDNMFIFKKDNIYDILRQISRWYNVDVSFAPGIKNLTYSGTFSRTAPLEVVLKMLKYADVKYKIEGRKLTVLQN